MSTNNPLHYPMRRHGMDHDRYDWSMISERPPVRWPQGQTLALWINVNLQFFPLNPQGQPIKLAGNMTMPYPDLRHYSLRDYGNRIGIFRILDALDAHGLRSSFAVNGRLAERAPALLETVLKRGDELLGHSWSMDTAHAGGLPADAEAELIERSLTLLRERSGQAVRGWLSPGKQQSAHTPELLRAAGIDYHCDWVNDELPYPFRTDNGRMWSLPLSTELEDRFVLMDNLHSAESWAQQVCDAADLLLAESQSEGGRVLALNLHPWVIGQPHRMRYLEQALDHIRSLPGVWNAMPGQIVDHVAATQAS